MIRTTMNFADRSLLLATLSGILFTAGSLNAQVAVNATGAAPHAQAILDISSTTKGFLAPRMTAAQRGTLATPGLIVYQTTPASGEGYWYYDGALAAWVPVSYGAGEWVPAGNAGINPATQYLGTTDAQDLVVRTNAVQRFAFLNGTGHLAVNTAAAPERVGVDGAMIVDGPAANNLQGNIQYNAATGAHEGNIDGTANGWYQLENVFREVPAQPYEDIMTSCAPEYRTIASTSAPLNNNAPGTNGNGGTTTTGTIETPYGQLWEDNRTQFLYQAQDLIDREICPGDITELAFYVKGAINTYNMQNAELKLKNTTANALTTAGFETGMTTVWTGNIGTAALTAGWNNYVFNTPFTWNGTANLVVEFCYNNSNWSGVSTQIGADNVSYAGILGLYCDACGQPNYASCEGLGSPGGCSINTTDNLVTCDGTLPQWLGAIGTANKRACVRLRAETGMVIVSLGSADYLVSDLPLMIGSAAWATLGGPPYSFKGPGTISAENSVWGGAVLLSDHVFDAYYDGAIRPEDAANVGDYSRHSVSEMVNYVERERHLPTIDGRDAWQERGLFSLDQLNTQLWVTVEEQALYIKELHERMHLLERHLVDRQLAQPSPLRGE